eukprot:TRINITY_DN18170_c0_g1_i1.p1 TRINITY_DN18170_c0_g1~~TRINITY_DN18170_c0_g1_i1.p1  ORF type:complete len:413 (+),score=118.82 TRINITY_DN18170_c0_g1_i1:79-1317(+)
MKEQPQQQLYPCAVAQLRSRDRVVAHAAYVELRESGDPRAAQECATAMLQLDERGDDVGPYGAAYAARLVRQLVRRADGGGQVAAELWLPVRALLARWLERGSTGVGDAGTGVSALQCACALLKRAEGGGTCADAAALAPRVALLIAGTPPLLRPAAAAELRKRACRLLLAVYPADGAPALPPSLVDLLFPAACAALSRPPPASSACLTSGAACAADRLLALLALRLSRLTPAPRRLVTLARLLGAPGHGHCRFFELFGEQDDLLVAAMHELLLAATAGITSRDGNGDTAAGTVACDVLDPHEVFLSFLDYVAFDSALLLDFIVGGETHFLPYAVLYLRLAVDDWQCFVRATRKADVRRNGCTMQAMAEAVGELRATIEKMQRRGQFPFNAAPLVTRLHQVEVLALATAPPP